MIPYLTDAEVRAALSWDELIPAMERALAALSAGSVVQPLREWLTIEEGERYWGVMPASAAGAMGVKLVSLYPANAGTGVPTVIALVILFRRDTGEPLAMLDGSALTALRTAAVSAAVTRRLASPESSVLALLGSGVQAATHLDALKRVRAFREVRVWSRTPEHAQRFAREHGTIAMDAESAVRGADVVVTATPAREPILRGAWLKPGAHVNAIGAPMPNWRELDDAAMANVVVVESRAAASEESGDVILSGARIHAEAGEIFAGTKTVPSGATTVFKSVGVAVEDVFAAQLAFDRSGRIAVRR
ncbi:MAG TPA: ornithine cyclodeaminase family protein [Casimicrobiaceae bacterium]|nr:ornithine cyclodeaminase family protein [Casimicrobiaceae bacterium]